MNLSDVKINTATDFTLENGLKTIAYQDTSNPILCVQLHIKTGSTKEDQHQSGYSHFIEHLTFKSTNNYSYNSISDLIPRLGGMINAYTDFDSTCYYVLIPSEHLDTALKVLAELAFGATFTAEDVKVEKDIIIEEIKQYENESETNFIEYIQNQYFIKNPMKHPVLGYQSSITHATYDSLRDFYRCHYRPDNAFLVISGDFDYDKLRNAVDIHFKAWNTPYEYSDKLDDFLNPEAVSFKTYFRLKKKSSPYLAFVLPELSERHPDANAMLIAMRLFAIGKSSRLYKRLVEKEKLCSSVKVSSLCGYLSGASVIHLTPNASTVLERIISIFFEEYHRIRDVMPAPEVFELVKKDILHSWMYSFETMEGVGSTIAAEEINGDYNTLYTYPHDIIELSSNDILKRIQVYWKQDNIQIFYQDSKIKFENLIKTLSPLPHTQNKPFIIHKKTSEVMHDKIGTNRLINNYVTIDSDNKIYEYKTSTGLRVVYKNQPEKQICGISISADISQLMENEHNRGVNYLTSTAMLYGTKLRSFEQIQDLSRKLGFSLRVSHHIDTTSFRAKCFNDDMAIVLDVLSDIMINPIFPTKYIHLLKTNLMDSYRRESNSPVNKSFRDWQRMLFGAGNNIDSSFGKRSEISRISKEDIITWHDSWNIARQFILTIIGSKPVEEVFALCENAFGNSRVMVSNNTMLLPQPIVSSQKTKRKLVHRDSEQAIINLGGFGCTASDQIQNTAFYLLSQALGGDINSRMFNILREKYGYAYQTGFDFTSISTLGFWNAYVFCDPDDYKDSLRIMKELITDVYKNGITEEELVTAKNYLIGMQRFDHESVSWQASTISNLLCLGYDIKHFLTREQRIRNVTLHDVHSTAQKWLSPDNFHIHISL